MIGHRPRLPKAASATAHVVLKTKLTVGGLSAALKKAAIRDYQAARDFYQKRSKPVPLEIENNLAWCLANQKETGEPEDPESLQEAQKIIDAVVSRLGEGNDLTAEDTQAWILYQQGRAHPEQSGEYFEKARAIYDRIVSKQAAPSYCFRYATVLAEMKKFPEALEQVDRALNSRETFEEIQKARNLKPKIRKAIDEQFRTATKA